jgi:hypothetical protein
MFIDGSGLRNVMRHLFDGLGNFDLGLLGGSLGSKRNLSQPARTSELIKFIRRADTDAAVRAGALIVLLLLLAVLRR